jgi:aminodeoxyfutalosine synthase
VLERGREAVENGCTEMHIVGGLHHQRKFDWYLNLIKQLHDNFPTLHLKGWTAVELNWFEFLTKQSTEWVLRQLLDAGLGSTSFCWTTLRSRLRGQVLSREQYQD